MQSYRLDRTAFRIATFQEADHWRAYWLGKSPSERLQAAWHLVCRAYNLDPEQEHRLDRTKFAMRKQPA
ncbi:MAG: hypothetical protein IPH12_07040 [Saprospirales bacterium]|nr:hypothetical protein [Saprospirales bacterium]MBK8922614.1 hypothetical protein [Saprospirales bacterium]